MEHLRQTAPVHHRQIAGAAQVAGAEPRAGRAVAHAFEMWLHGADAGREGRARMRGLNADRALAWGVAAAIAVVVFPLPTPLLDGLLAAQLGLSIVILVAALGVRDPLDLSSFPAVLLLTTLLRLALNVSTTRLILGQADAGDVVAAFGDVVVAGNVIVGLVVFGVLTLVQFLVISQGAERVAQVAARFALDGLPGAQLAIDAELRAGQLGPEAARARRDRLARQSGMYGALDGAMKFVRGDALAGLAIVAINAIAGVAIGMGQRGLSLGDATRLYTTLTVGDGLVTQLPAVLTATAAALVATRTASPDPRGLGASLAHQLAADGRPLVVAAGLLAVLAVLPGLPTLPLAGVALGLGGLALVVRRDVEPTASTTPLEAARPAPALGLELGPAAAAALGAPPAAVVEQARLLFGRTYGVTPPAVALATGEAGGYVLRVGGAPVARGALADADAARALTGTMVATWRRHAEAILPVQQIADRLQALEATDPALVRAAIPRRVDVPRLAVLLRDLLREDVPVRDLRAALEVLAALPPTCTEPADQLRALRRGLAAHITARVAPEAVVDVLFPAAAIEDALRTPTGLGLDAIDELLEALAEQRALFPSAILMVAADVRAALRQVVAGRLPDLAVVSAEELLPGVQTRAVGLVGDQRA